jgi:hypothetical protein
MTSPRRRRVLMHQLLEGVVADPGAMGATLLEGCPVEAGGERVDQTAGYMVSTMIR